MGKTNCWEILRCGREPGGSRSHELGVCPAARAGACSGLNGGAHGGRACWAVAGTFCDDEVQGSFVSKHATCATCEVFQRVQREEGARFTLAPPGPHHSMYEQFVALVSIVESMNAVVCVTDLDTHRILFVNAYAERLFGPDLVGKRCDEVVPEGAGPCRFSPRERLVENGQPAPPVVRELESAGSHRWFQTIERAIRWWDGGLVRMEVAFDVSDRKAAEQFREQYVGLIGHDLRNPLNALMIQAQMLRRSFQRRSMDGDASEMDALIGVAEKMNGMIADLLETTRLESGRIELQLQPLDVTPWVDSIVRRVKPAEARDRVVVRAANAPVKALADPLRLERVLDNLLSNALKYSGEERVQVTTREVAGEAIVSVVDRGIGVAPEEMPNLFQRFYRSARAGSVKGLGLGLYNARLIVEAHGGRIWAESRPGAGAAFHFAVPAAPEA